MDNEIKRTGIVIQGLDIFDIVKFINKTNRKYQATLLSNLEIILGDDERFPEIRKLILDSTNNFTRSIIKTIFGDIES